MTGDAIFTIDPNACYEAEEVALLLFRTTVRSFNRHRRQRAREGFPRPISNVGKKVWSGADLIAWRDRDKAVTALPAGVTDLGAHLAARAKIAAERNP